MDCYDAKWCPDGECDLCDFWLTFGVSRRRSLWLRFLRFFVRIGRRDLRAGKVPRWIIDAQDEAAKEEERASRPAPSPRSEAEGTRAPACHCGDVLRERPCPFCSPEAYYGAGRAPVPAESATKGEEDGR